jgi:hypothetical protein
MRFLALLGLAAFAVAAPKSGDADFPKPCPSARHTAKVEAVRKGGYDLVMIGDSITQTVGDEGGEWLPLRAVWDRHLASLKALNLGYSGYRTEKSRSYTLRFFRQI